MIAGRCECGVAFSVFLKRDWDAHLRCFGLRWCRVRRGCPELRALRRGPCRSCKAYRNRKWWTKERKRNGKHYRQDKARKRVRFRTEPLYRAGKLGSLAPLNARRTAA